MTKMSGSMCSMTPPVSPRLHDAELQDVDMLDDFDSPPLNLIMFQDLGGHTLDVDLITKNKKTGPSER